MSTTTTTVRTCDECREEIAAGLSFIAAGTYGADFHVQCWDRIGGPRVARLLGLDEVEYTTVDRDGGLTHQRRAWAPA